MKPIFKGRGLPWVWALAFFSGAFAQNPSSENSAPPPAASTPETQATESVTPPPAPVVSEPTPVPAADSASSSQPQAAASVDTAASTAIAPADSAAPDSGASAEAPQAPPVPAEADSDSGEIFESEFVLPLEGEIFYEPEMKVLITLPGSAPPAMALLLDGYTEISPLTIRDGLLSVTLKDLKAGVHELTLLFFNDRNEIMAKHETRFFVRLPEPEKTVRKNEYRQFGRVLAKAEWKGGEARGRILSQRKLSATLAKTSAGADTLTGFTAGSKEKPLSQDVDGLTEAAYNVKYKQLQAYGKVLLSTGENRFRQPGHRFTTSVKYGPWAWIKAGDVYPSYNDLILSGTRIRGGEAALNLVIGEKQYGSLKVATGESRREIPAYVAEYTDPSSPNGVRSDTVAGGFGQNITAARLGFGGGPRFDLGLTFLKASDKPGSRAETMLNDSLRGSRPVDNLVPGVDMRIGFWDGRIQLYGEGAASLYTRDASLGALSTDSFDIAFDPASFEDIFVVNSTTRGWQYLVSSKTDVGGFFETISAYRSGIVASLPLPGVTTETELRYSHLGLEYHSEGNPFLGGNPGDGFTIIQKAVVLNNRLSLGLEFGNYAQDLGITAQTQRDVKGEVRYTPGQYQPSFWIGGGRTNTAPDGNYSSQFSSSFWNLNTGAYHQFQLPDGKLFATVLYGFTQSDFSLVYDSSGTTVSNVFPSTRTNIVNAAGQYKQRYSGFVPRVSYSFAHNGVQLPTHSVTLGAVQPFLQNRLKLDVSASVGQYPESLTHNDISLGESANLDYTFARNQVLRLREKWVQYGKRRNILVGANYELFF